METPCSPFESAPRSSSPSSCHVASPVLMEPAPAPSVVTTATLAAYTSQPASQPANAHSSSMPLSCARPLAPMPACVSCQHTDSACRLAACSMQHWIHERPTPPHLAAEIAGDA
jgi:hypothetical protein